MSNKMTGSTPKVTLLLKQQQQQANFDKSKLFFPFWLKLSFSSSFPFFIYFLQSHFN